MRVSATIRNRHRLYYNFVLKNTYMNFRKLVKCNVIVMFITVGFFVASCSNKVIVSDLSSHYGVWGNQNCELVQTAKYTLIFNRKQEKITTILRRNVNVSDTIYSEFVLGYVFDGNLKSYQKINCSDKQKRILIRDLISLNDNKLELKIDSGKQTLDMIEKIDILTSYDMPFADKNNIGKCLQYWQLGTIEHKLDLNDFWIEIGTNKHLYIFISNPNQLYCRAARIRSNEHGSVFSQNIRLMFSAYSKETTVFMSDDNYITAKSDVNINDSLFKPNACSFENDGIYWSFISNESDSIKLNGCGSVYTFERPLKDDKRRVEWFKYKVY